MVWVHIFHHIVFSYLCSSQLSKSKNSQLMSSKNISKKVVVDNLSFSAKKCFNLIFHKFLLDQFCCVYYFIVYSTSWHQTTLFLMGRSENQCCTLGLDQKFPCWYNNSKCIWFQYSIFGIILLPIGLCKNSCIHFLDILLSITNQ